MKKSLQYTILMIPEAEGGFTVTVPAFPGCITYGKTIEEATAMAHDAIVGYIASLKKHKEPIPTEEGRLQAVINILPEELTYA